jgi:hypothetical protein
MKMEWWWNDNYHKKKRKRLREKPAPVLLCPP